MNPLLRIITIVLIFSPNIGFSQSFSVKWNQATSMPPKARLEKFIGATEGSYYYIRDNEPSALGKGSPVLVKNSLSSHEELFSVDIPTQIQGKKAEFEQAMLTAKGITLFFSQFDKKADVSKLYAITYDTLGKPYAEILLDEGVANEKPTYVIDFNKEYQRFLLIRRVAPNREIERMYVKVYDASFRLNWEKFVNIVLGRLIIRKFFIDEDANLYAVATENQSYMRTCKLFYYDYLNNQVSSKVIDIEKFGKVCSLNCFYRNKQVVLTGVYRGETPKWIKGVYVFKVNCKTLAVETESNVPFTEKSVLAFTGMNANMKKDGLPASLEHLTSYLNDMGEIFIILEQHFSMHVNSLCNNSSSGFEHFYNSVVVTCLNPDGSLKWESLLVKFQSDCSDYQCSILSSFVQGKLLILCNEDYFKPKKPGGDTSQMVLAGKGVKGAIVDGGYSTLEEDANGAENMNISLRINLYMAAGNQLILYSEENGKHRFGTVVVNNR